MEDEPKVIKGRMDTAGLMGPIWIGGWLFTIGYLHLHILRGILAIVLWPYYLGMALGR